MIERDYPELVGKTVDYRAGRSTLKGIVIGCDYHIGITIVNEDNKNEYLVCLNGPLSKCWKDTGYRDIRRYQELFIKRISQIETGVYDVREKLNDTAQPSAANCPFGQ